MVQVKVDLERREKLRRLHTTTHIINHCAREVLGNHIWQNGSNLKPEIGSLDITHYQNLSQEEIFEIEKRANKVVFENRKVTIEELDRTEAEKKYGYSLYQGGAIPMKSLRVIKVLDNDIEACGGIHMEETGGIGLIKIVESQKIQDGVVRLKYVVNEFALDETNKTNSLLKEIEEIFSVDSSKIVKTSQKFFEEWKTQKKEIEKLKNNLKQSYVEVSKLNKDSEMVIEGNFDMGFLMELFNEILKTKKSFKLDSSNFTIATVDFEIKDFKKQIKKGSYNIHIK